MRQAREGPLSMPLGMEVEDVAMVKLDAIALDPRFRVYRANRDASRRALPISK